VDRKVDPDAAIHPPEHPANAVFKSPLFPGNLIGEKNSAISTALIGRTYDCTVQRRFTLKNLANRAVPHISQRRILTRWGLD